MAAGAAPFGWIPADLPGEQVIRPQDTVARLGGDEFAVVAEVS